MGPHAPRDDAAFRRPGGPASPPATHSEPWTWGREPDAGSRTPLTAAPLPVGGARDPHVIRASWDPHPAPIVPDGAPSKGPDWARIITRSLALVAAGVCAGILLSRPWAPREQAPPAPAGSSVSVPSSSAEPTRR